MRANGLEDQRVARIGRGVELRTSRRDGSAVRFRQLRCRILPLLQEILQEQSEPVRGLPEFQANSTCPRIREDHLGIEGQPFQRHRVHQHDLARLSLHDIPPARNERTPLHEILLDL